eukprot:TRINITY_DN16113_c0_g1_i1.p1 TRINITY_DN16113_c0_g1~~TRINITY_DN16113_c0_g1_i1.p1  ORF type:complete len:147 (+),score=42.62 TRINITY_DN16113_c0_g1_i1:139-579(+)
MEFEGGTARRSYFEDRWEQSAFNREKENEWRLQRKENQPSAAWRRNHPNRLPRDVWLKIGPPPHRPASAFQIYLQEGVKEVDPKNNRPKHEVTKILCDRWLKELTSAEKDRYRQKENEARQIFRELLTDYQAVSYTHLTLPTIYSV